MLHRIEQSAYRARPELSSSEVAAAFRDPRAVAHNRRVPRADTPAMRGGRMLHAALLEPETLPRMLVTAPTVNLSTTAGKADWTAWLAEHGIEGYHPREAAISLLAARGIEVADGDERERVMETVSAVHRHLTAGPLFRSGVAERSAFASLHVGDTDGGQPILCGAKARPDWIASDGTLVQVKTSAQGHDPERFRWTLRDHGYDIAEAWCAAVCAASGVDISRVAWVVCSIPARLGDPVPVHVYTATIGSSLLSSAWEAACYGARAWMQWQSAPEVVRERLERSIDISEWSRAVSPAAMEV